MVSFFLNVFVGLYFLCHFILDLFCIVLTIHSLLSFLEFSHWIFPTLFVMTTFSDTLKPLIVLITFSFFAFHFVNEKIIGHVQFLQRWLTTGPCCATLVSLIISALHLSIIIFHVVRFIKKHWNHHLMLMFLLFVTSKTTNLVKIISLHEEGWHVRVFFYEQKLDLFFKSFRSSLVTRQLQPSRAANPGSSPGKNNAWMKSSLVSVHLLKLPNFLRPAGVSERVQLFSQDLFSSPLCHWQCEKIYIHIRKSKYLVQYGNCIKNIYILD